MWPEIAIPATLLLVYRAWSRKSLTPVGIAAAVVTACTHALHPTPVPFACLIVFYFSGTKATRIKQNIKKNLTVSSSGSQGGDGPRALMQVLANSIVGSILVLLHVRQLSQDQRRAAYCFDYKKDALLVGIIANYAAVAADTFSSELGILSTSPPRLITSLTLRKVPRGTNGGVTLTGLGAGLLGAFLIALTTLTFLPFCPVGRSGLFESGPQNDKTWALPEKSFWAVAISIWGLLGSVVDSVLGGLLQSTVVEKKTGKVVEGVGGGKVSVVCEDRANDAARPAITARKVETGHDILSNNGVNLAMALIMSLGAIAIARYIPMQRISA